MKTEVDNGIYCACIVVVLHSLILSGEEKAALTAKEIAQDYSIDNLQDDFYNGAKSVLSQLSKTEHSNQEVIRFIPLYTKFLKKFNSDFSPKSFLKRTFRGQVFSKGEVNNLEKSSKMITLFFIHCLSGTARPEWFE